jgi:O-antigen/teichoic acid export membrane protein
MQAGRGKELTWHTLSLRTLWDALRTKIIARKFVQDVGVLTAANFAGAAMNLIQGLLVARWLGPEFYGVVALVMSYPSLVYGFFDARSFTASVKYLAEYNALNDRDRALSMCKLGYTVDLTIACLTFLVLLVTAHLAAQHIVHDPAVAGLMLIYGAAMIPRALVGTSNAVLTTFGRFPVIASIEMTITFVRMVLVLGLVLAGWQVAGVIWANAVAAAALGLVYAGFAWVLIRRAWGGSVLKANLKALGDSRRQIFTFLAYNDLNALVAMIPNQLDVIFLGYVRGPTEVGYYKLAKSLSSVFDYLKGPLHSVVFAQLARLWALGHKRALHEKIKKLALWIGAPMGLAVVAAAGFAPWGLPWLVGEHYLPAVGAAQILFVGAAVSLAFFWFGPVYLAKGHVQQMFLVGSSVTLALALFYPWAVNHWGYLGAAVWTLALHVGRTGASGVWLWRQSKSEHGRGMA